VRIAVFGAGAWGTALALHAAQRHEVVLWGRDAAQIRTIAERRENQRYLPGYSLPEQLAVTADAAFAQAFAGAEGLRLVATPLAGLRSALQMLGFGVADVADVADAADASDAGTSAAASSAPVFWLCKGLTAQTLELPHQLAQSLAEQAPVRGLAGSVAPGAQEQIEDIAAQGVACGALSGPSFAQEVAAGLPFALVAASVEPAAQQRVVAALHHGAGRIYTSADIVGVECAGALKNVMAIAVGICDGLALGLNARAALITRGLAEMTRLGLAMGAQATSFLGLAGLGDLLLTTTGDLSRNRQVGLALARGVSLASVLANLGHVAEGVETTRAVCRLARERGVEMPIAAAVHAVLFEQGSPHQAMQSLLAREPRAEGAWA